MAAPSLSITIVTYRTEPRHLEAALRSLAISVEVARASGAVESASLFLVDNGPAGEGPQVVRASRAWPPEAGTLDIVSGQGNVGYGRANNLVLGSLRSQLHLIMNPDVELERDALRMALAALEEHPEVGLVAPAVHGEDGALQYLCRRYPSVWVLFLRGFAPEPMRRRFARALEHYEMRDLVANRFVAGVPLASGCFMLVRTPIFTRLGGFDPGFFMYFEDYDLSLRLGRVAAVAYVPQARIVHHGGDASRKGARHVGWFIRSAWRFFSRHGWKIA